MISRTVARTAVRSIRATGAGRTGMSGAVVARGATPSSAVACCEALSPVARVAVVSASRLQSRVFSSTRTALSKDTTWQSKGAVTYAELKPETESPSGEITIIDVREPNEVAQGIIPSAVNVPLSQFQKAFSGSGGDFIRDFAFNRPEYDDKVVFYCRSGKRSQQALEFAQKNGWWNTRNYEGSWLDWVQQEEARGQASKIKEDDD